MRFCALRKLIFFFEEVDIIHMNSMEMTLLERTQGTTLSHKWINTFSCTCMNPLYMFYAVIFYP